MKNLLFIIILITMVSCERAEEPVPNPDPTTPAAMSSDETALLGTWILDSTVVISSGLNGTTVHNKPAQCMLDLTSGVPANNPDSYTCMFGLTCAPYDLWWTATATTLKLGGGNYQILEKTANKLVLRSSNSSMDVDYYLRK